MVVDRLVEDQLLGRVGLLSYTCVSAPEEAVWMQLVGYYHNFSREITPTAQRSRPPLSQKPCRLSGSPGLARVWLW